MCRSLLTFRSNLLFASSGSKSKLSMKEAASSYHTSEASTPHLLICFFVGLFCRNEVSTLMYTAGNKICDKYAMNRSHVIERSNQVFRFFFSIREARGLYLFPDTFSPVLKHLVSFRNFQANNMMTISKSFQIHHS